MSRPSGMPLLSGPPPQSETSEPSCRKCNKEFNVLFTRSRRCNHCGWSYCHSCSDYQALMPRRDRSGYDTVPVCTYCIDNLYITAAGKGQLKKQSLTKLKNYAKDYGIDVSNVVEKDDLIERLLSARVNGCLSPPREDYYRRHSVPQRSGERPRGIFSRAMDAVGADFQNHSGSSQHNSNTSRTQQQQPRARTTSYPSSFPRPDLEPDREFGDERQSRASQGSTYRTGPQSHAQQPSSRSSQGSTRPNTTYTSQNGQRQQPSQSAPSNQPNLNVPPTNPRPRSASAPRTPTGPSRASSPPRQIPSLDELLELSSTSIQALSISTLKAILFRNHVNTGMIVEKSELVAKVRALIDDERAEREAHARREEEEERELREALERSQREHEELESGRAQSGEPQGSAQTPNDANISGSDDTSPAQPSPVPPAPDPQIPRGKLSEQAKAMASHLERTGLCVICQDEEANIAVVDCGHLAMCRACSDLIMKSTRECPLCRTRIVTEARLLRIFKA